MNGYESHRYNLIYPGNELSWMKFRFKTIRGIVNLTDQEAEALIAKVIGSTLLKADHSYGAGLAKPLGIGIDEVPRT